MPSTRHEVLIEMFRHRPPLVAELLTGPFGIKVPEWQRVRVLEGDLSELLPTEYRADLVSVLCGGDGEPLQAVVVEVQLRRDRRKRRSWAAYVCMLYARLGCPTELLVISPSRATAAWAAIPIEVGSRSVVTPLAVGPDRVPVVTDAGQASDNPELAVLSAIAHGAGPERQQVLEALGSALQTVDHEHATLYAGIVLSALPAAIRVELERIMSTATGEYRDYLSPFVNRFVNQGRREGEAKALLAVLAARGIEVPESARSRITECTDPDRLESWVRRAATADSVDDLFD